MMENKESEKPKGKKKSVSRFLEIAGILQKHKVILGVTPEKLRAILEDLGPTFVKLGQLLSMRTDLLPAKYCEELQKLRSEVKPMPMDEVTRVVEASLGTPLREAFPTFETVPLGSASIAQAHRATLPDGERVVVKVQREGIYDRMASDIALLRKAVKPLKFVPTGETVDFDMVISELWSVSQQEMDFLHEADNAEEFRRLNDGIEYIACPMIYRELSTRQILVMEAIDGLMIDDCEALKAEEYDLSEICLKLCTNYMKQVLDDGFFHADPHPGNLRVRDGQIVWLDWGMVGRLSAKDQAAFEKALSSVSVRDAEGVTDAVIAITNHTGPVNRKALHADVKQMLDEYLDMDIGEMNIGDIVQQYLRIAQNHGLTMPSGITLLGRGISTLEGVVADISPDTNLMQIVAQRFAARKLKDIDWKQAVEQNGRAIYESLQKSLSTPALLNDTLRAALGDGLAVRVETEPSAAAKREDRQRSEKQNRTAVFCSLFIGSSVLAITGIEPAICGLPWPSACGFGAAALYAVYNLVQRKRHQE